MKFSLLTLLTVSAVKASKDNQSYGSVVNPNIDEKMYWKDASNVLEDLSKFSKLYVEYHGCAWSPVETWQANGQDAAENNNGEVRSTDSWYMGKGETKRANVAYSLYGVLAGENDEGCSKNTFINSFFTSAGLESYLQAFRANGLFENTQVNGQCLIYDGDSEADGWNGMYGSYNFSPNAYGYYGNDGQQNSYGYQYKNYAEGMDEMDEEQAQQKYQGGYGNYRQYSNNYWNRNGNGDEAEENQDENYRYYSYNKYAQYGNNKYQQNNQQQEGDEGAEGQQNGGNRALYSHGEEKYSGYNSRAVACHNGGFVVKQFEGAFCSADKATKTLDNMKTLNRQLNQQQCYPVYINQYASAYGNADGNNNNNGGGASLDLISYLLPYSKACSTLEYPNACPDPYGKVKQYEKVLNQATSISPGSGDNGDKAFMSVLLILASGMMIWAAVNFKPKSENDLREASSFARSISTAASQASSKFEATRSFLQAENDEEDEGSDEDSVMVSKPAIDQPVEANKEVADTMLGDSKQKKKRRFKRPIMARLSMLIMGRKRNKKASI